MLRIITDNHANGTELYCSIIGATCRVTISNKCPNVAFVSSLVVDRDYRKGGLGSELLSEVINEAKKRGCSVVSLEVNYKSWQATWYRRVGFIPCCDCYNNDLITMSLVL